uniref:Macaca fascicularis brain cDNA, clone: QflA-18389 n=1 Tax=Macaca fascicularis TaxID=9541 RepID=I7GMU8_MACFA|nr:unnamed protein product [Macaca fascicularis]
MIWPTSCVWTSREEVLVIFSFSLCTEMLRVPMCLLFNPLSCSLSEHVVLPQAVGQLPSYESVKQY